ncbi:four helix bundle protein [Flavobacterium sp.]|uniref:four helix bundle protein n=1 Tax=Flavobacterium sp. TaxID=239 RepID=UPI0035AF3F09
MRRSSRSVCANLAEAFRKRRYPKNFVSKLSDCEAEAAETQVWSDFALACEYITIEDYEKLYKEYDMIIGILVKMIVEPEKWNL